MFELRGVSAHTSSLQLRVSNGKHLFAPLNTKAGLLWPTGLVGSKGQGHDIGIRAPGWGYCTKGDKLDSAMRSQRQGQGKG